MAAVPKKNPSDIRDRPSIVNLRSAMQRLAQYTQNTTHTGTDIISCPPAARKDAANNHGDLGTSPSAANIDAKYRTNTVGQR